MDIAIIGVSCQFPDAKNYIEFWGNIVNHRNSVTKVAAVDKETASLSRESLQWPDASENRWAALVNTVDGFDNQFFGIIPKVAETMDPQQRIMLELTWSCLEDAGIMPSTLRGNKVGVIIGVFNNDYKELQENANNPVEAHHSTGTATSIIANRISHFFDFHGPSIAIDTACSSSLNAMHAAIQAINQGDCEMAISGGVNLILTSTRHQSFAKMGMLSPTGACHSFDSNADGYVRGEGAGVLLLKPLEKALADGDVIHGVVKGSAINHCGTSYTLTYPSADAQAEVIVAANTQAGVPVNSIGLVEAHGTGTPKGDPIEFEGLTQAFNALAQQQGVTLDDAFCGLTSVKSNIGHLEAAAGVAGVIKILQAFKHRKLPPLRNFTTLNPRIDAASTPFYFVEQEKDWQRIDAATPRRAGVSSFGFGGTNAHVVLEEAPEPVRRRPAKGKSASRNGYFIALSAKSPAALLQRQKDLIQWLRENPKASLGDVSATLLTRREHFAYRYGCAGQDIHNIINELEKSVAEGPLSLEHPAAADQAQKAAAEAAVLFEAISTTDASAVTPLLLKMSECYARGATLDWSPLFKGADPQCVALPTYPFVHAPFWITPRDNAASPQPALRAQPQRVVNVGSSRYKTVLQSDEFFIADHQIDGQAILPGVMSLEWVRAAFADALTLADASALTFSQVTWLRPFTCQGKAADIIIQLDPHPSEEQRLFQLLGSDDKIYCHGTVGLSSEARPAAPVATMADDARTLDETACYQRLESLQMCYGAGMRSISHLTFDEHAGVANLTLPAAQPADFIIHPSMADGAVQAAVVWVSEKLRSGQQATEQGPLVIPFSLEALALLQPCSAAMTATVTLAGETTLRDEVIKVDIHLTEAHNPENTALIFKGLCLRVLNDGLAAKEPTKTVQRSNVPPQGAHLYQPHWVEKALPEADASVEQIVLVGSEQDVERFARLIAQSQAATRIQRILFAAAPQINADPQTARVRPGNSDDFVAAVDALLAQGATFRQVLWVSAELANDDFALRLSTGPYSLFALTQALMRKVKKVNFVHFHQADASLPDVAAISGFYRTLRVEKPDYIGRVVHCDNDFNLHPLPALIYREFADVSKDADVRYVKGTRQVRRFVAAANAAGLNLSGSAPAALRPQGIYLITGGMGALGLIFARFLCSTYGATVYLSGRSALDESRQQQLDALSELGGKALYVACDIGDAASVQALLETIRAAGHRLNGIIHSAGVIEDNFILRKSREAFERVVTPKTLGTWLLDQATRDLPLDFFVLFSSVTGVLGNMGQCDYAFGNAFEDDFSRERNARQQRGERSGKALSLNWPYWKDGGMRLTDKEEGFLKNQFGIVPLLTDDGIAVFNYALQSGASQMVVMPGEAARINEVLGVVDITPPEEAVRADSGQSQQDIVIRYLSELFARKLQIPAHFERHGFFRDYGFDSVVVIELVNELKKTFGSSLPMTLFFEHQTMEELSRFLLENYDEVCRGLVGAPLASSRVIPAQRAATPAVDFVREVSPGQSGVQNNDDDIAIVGIAGRYPEADSLEQFWNNLAQGRDCVIEVPAERWNARWYKEGAATPGKSYSRWGGFLSGVERFDPRYFNISPKETEIMDPNEWLFLETVTHAIEDAGYTADKLTPSTAGRENRVGVYVGMMWGDYQLHAHASPEDQWTTSHSSYWSVANRVSHFFNFSGPSMALDTACSSSLTAIHVACNAIRSGDVPVAIAGGVNLSLHPYKYHLLSNMHFLSSDGRCRSFGEGGTGYVPGEGVGAVVLKPLSQARRDGDHIYGIIRGTSVNHGGKTSGFTVPNAKRQADLIVDALTTAKVNPRHISYVEAHGTGTKLGDPIEISGLNKAFSIAGDSTKYCAIGSVKANIGHLEAAAGMSALTKVLLQMKHQTLVPSIQSKAVNPFIDFQSGPFRIQQSLEPWPRPVLAVTESSGSTVTKEIPRIAGISSFGAGGSNAHLIVEEYIEPKADPADEGKPALIVLSARRETALRTMAEQLADFMAQHADLSLQDIAYTLQVGRVAHEYRVALVAEVAADAVNLLRAYARQQLSGIMTGHRDNARQATDTPPLAEWITLGRLGALGEAWANGHGVDWAQLHAAQLRRRVSLPGYAFQRQDCWAPTLPAERTDSFLPGAAALHPLIDSNVSTLASQAFRKSLRASEFLLNDHRLGDNRILPAAAFIEMALSASELALLGNALPQAGAKPVLSRVHDLTWRQPILVSGDALEIEIALTPSQGGLDFDIYRHEGEKRHVFGSGRLCEETAPSPKPVELQRLLTRGQLYERDDIEAAFKQRGFSFGPAFQVIERLYTQADEALSELKFPDYLQITPLVQPFILPPSLLDGAFRTALGIGGLYAGVKTLEVPVALAGLQVCKPVAGIRYAYARRNVEPGAAAMTASYDICLLDSVGDVVVSITRLQTQAVPQLGMKVSAVAQSAKPAAQFTASPVSAQPLAISSREALINTLISHVIDVTRLDAGDVSATAPLAEYGLDSMMILALNERLSSAFENLSQTLFYEYQDLASLADYLLEQHPQYDAPLTETASLPSNVNAPVSRSVRDGVLDYLIAGVIAVTRLDEDEVQPATELANYGLDSMMILALNEKLAATFGEVSQTLFYEYQDIDSLADFLCESYPRQAAALQPATVEVIATPPLLPDSGQAATNMADAQEVSAISDRLFDSLVTAIGAAAANCSALMPLHQWPLDTVSQMRLQHELDARFNGVNARSVFFYNTLVEWAMALQATQAPAVMAQHPQPPVQPTLASLLNGSRLDAGQRRPQGASNAENTQHDIAVIGLSGRYPGAKNVEEFWANLTAGVDSVTEIPLSRWDYRKHYSPQRGPKDKVYSKWGGFIDDIEQFDSQYFNISPREAELLDPQERLFLQTAWECVSDASYSRHSLSQSRVGVYVGVMWGQYQFIETTAEQYQTGFPMSLHSSVANRVSFYFNLNGPSVALDTMCSSSLTALHMACQAIQSGDCKMAIAGGVNLIVHPMKYYQLGQSQFLSSDGRCRAFGEGGDGYVPGEGMGAVLLKPLQQALADGDQIYGVIKATAINHGGKTSGFTVPNQAAQSNVISNAFERAGWEPASVDYIEAHGTGTMLGDPIEISGLSKAFARINTEKGIQGFPTPGHCRIGSVKSNIGHLESAAGIAGLTKILLQMRHRQFVPSLHSQTLNSRINFETSTFRVVQSLEDWASAPGTPRRAGLSAFGAGGSNASVLIEEAPTLSANALPTGESYLWVLSADSETRLSRYVEHMIVFLDKAVNTPETAPSLASLAFSSLIGREAMTERLAVVASSLGDLLGKLEQYRDEGSAQQLFRGRIAGSQDRLDTILDGTQLNELVSGLVQQRQLVRLGRLWTTTLDVNWQQFARPLCDNPETAGSVRRVSFPPLPLMTRRHWLAQPSEQALQGRVNSLHPLIDENISTLSQQKFSKQLTGQETYLRDHLIGSDKARMILPGSAYVEMIHAAGQLAIENDWKVAAIRHLMWMNSVEVDAEPVEIAIDLVHLDGESVKVAVNNLNTAVLSVEAELVYRSQQVEIADEWIDLDALRSRGLLENDRAALYAEFAKMGFAYGPSYQVTHERYRFADAALSYLRLPDSVSSADAFYLHPSLLDGALRTCLAVGLTPVEYATPIVPFYLGELEFRHPLGRECYAYVTRTQSTVTDSHVQKHDITLVDTDGRVLARLKEFAARRLEKETTATPRPAQQDVQYYGYDWQPSPLAASTPLVEAARVLVLADDSELADALRELYGERGSVITVTHGAAFEQHDVSRFSVDTQSPSSLEALCAQLKSQQTWPTHIVHAVGADLHFDHLVESGIPSILHAGLQSLRHLFVALEKAQPRQVMRCVNVYRAQSSQVEPQHDAISGYARSLLTINHRFELFTLRSDADTAAALATQVYQEFVQRLASLPGLELAYRQGQRHQRQLTEIVPPKAEGLGSVEPLPLVRGGHYLITGGAGKLGLLMAHYLASRYQARVVLSGRSAQINHEVQQQIATMREQGAEVLYVAADVALYGQAESLLAEAKAAFGALNGVLHCAGVASDTPMTELQEAEFNALIGPKIDGLVALDRATAQEPLAVFINFSSVSAVLGDLGSGAYAAGNRFMDSHALWRNQQVSKGRRSGQSLSVNWPLWASGQMNIAAEDASLFEFSGMAALQQEAGIIALERALLEQRPELLVAVGDRNKVARALRIPFNDVVDVAPSLPVNSAPARVEPTKNNDSAYLHSENALRQHISTVTKIPASDIAVDATFEQLGMDSIMLMELRALLEKEYPGLSKTAPFEYNTTAKLAGYLCERYGVTQSTPSVATVNHRPASATAAPAFKRALTAATVNVSGSPFARAASLSSTPADADSDAVAIIGLAGEFPGVDNLTDFWATLQAGKENLTAIPPARWAAVEDDNGNPRYVNRGGFLNKANVFDPDMFRMSSEEASRLDPQVRVLLRSAWHALEDAGYTPSALKSQQVGVYVGAMNEDFTWVMSEYYARTGNYPGAGSVVSELANRISFLMDLHGPSFSVATTCASSLTSVHIARKAILGGECDMALAGGINLSLHPSKYMLLQDMKVLSSDGKEHTFDERASGLIPSEGSGIVVLKRLSAALADGDTVYGVLRGSSIGHAGTGAGQYLPNLAVMEETAARALKESRIDVNELTYIESHGAATELGDPIELKALSNALRRQTEAQQFCALGTKANLGHMEAASGICSLIKVLLSMQHGRLSPCVNLKNVNASFEHQTSPFLFPHEARAWDTNGRGTRIAGINSYGMGGSTAFVVVESAEQVLMQSPRPTPVENAPQIVVLSAQRAERLLAYAAEMRDFVERQGSTLRLADLAYTSQVGRIMLENRLAIVAVDAADLLAKLERFIAHPEATHGDADIHSGNVHDAKEVSQLVAGEAGKHFITALLQSQQLGRVATLWCRGCEVDWSLLHLNASRRRVAFPGYPFANQPCDLNAALALDISRRKARNSELEAMKRAAENVLPAVPQAWFASTIAECQASALDDEALHAFWAEQLHAEDDVGSLIAPALLGGAEALDAEDAEQPLINVERQISQDTVDALQICTQRLQVTLETLVVAGWALLANRHVRVKLSQFGVIRGFNNEALRVIPARVQVVGRHKVGPWLGSVEQQLEKYLEHAAATLGQIEHWVDDAPLFDSAVAILDDSATVNVNDAVAVLFAVQPDLHLALLVSVEAHSLSLRIDCRGLDTTEDNLNQLLEQWVTLLEGLATHLDKNPAALPMRSKGEGRKAFWKTLEQLNQQEQLS
ncbi:SDR family NAD(P)-dependent oxidoreductase [Rouxiella badensis]|uniref:SDR family NAD(P)-dependent oxidoreductase n=1 Tax=Rouxiella badensis TaxID=1646377 RepID=UPI0013EF1749|nr:SDR family NAD(P)-dependent oxidoreductase [Rouxiella badensis]QII39187.1 SDR family NAD(P)-dependent oxidoreductase [Rouxiella badensis]